MLAIGHRGAAGHEPENTLRSVLRAVRLHVDWIEVDVQAVDGELKGTHLDPVQHGNHFWFAWAVFRPDTKVIQ